MINCFHGTILHDTVYDFKMMCSMIRSCPDSNPLVHADDQSVEVQSMWLAIREAMDNSNTILAVDITRALDMELDSI